MDGVDVKLHLVPTPSSPDLPLGAVWGRVSEERMSHHLVTELFRCVGQH
jgi:hypothetical protein